MRIFTYQETGKYHILNSQHCQDYFRYERTKLGVDVFVVSDGAGGALYPDIGSKSNADGVVRLFQSISLNVFCEMDTFDQKKMIIESCRREIFHNASLYEDLFLNEYSATLLFVAMDEDHLMIGHLGDGLIFAKDDEGKSYISDPENIGKGRYTYFTVSPDAEERLRLYYFDRNEIQMSSITLMTDGVEPLFHEISLGFGKTIREWEQLLYSLPDNEHFERQIRKIIESDETLHDDKTILSVVLNPAEGKLFMDNESTPMRNIRE